MKKQLLFIALSIIAISLQAQTGNVGINTQSPAATLDVAGKPEDVTKLDGVIAPRITGDQLRAKTYTVAQKGAIVFVTAADTAPANQTVNVKAPGYYFFDGTLWTAFNAGDAEWIYENDTIKLRRSGIDSFKNKVYYTKTGEFRNLGRDENYTTNSLDADNSYTPVITQGSLNNPVLINSAFQRTTFNSIDLNTNGVDESNGKSSLYLVNKSDNRSMQFHNQNSMVVPSENANNYMYVYNNPGGLGLSGTGNIRYSIGTYGGVSINNSQKSDGYITGVLGHATFNGTGNILNLYGSYGRVHLLSGNGIVDRAAAIRSEATTQRSAVKDATLVKVYSGVDNIMNNNSQNTGTGVSLAGIRNSTTQSGKTLYPDMYGIVSHTAVGDNAVKPTNLYGLYIGNATGATTNNYSVYTNTGKVSLGDVLVLRSSGTKPASSTDPSGENGEIRYDGNFIYIKTGNVWKRSALSTF